VDGSGVIVAASNTTITLTANSVANNQFQTGSIENYLRANTLDFGMRNRIINGAMRIDQRNSGAANTPVNNGYTLDRWKFGLTQASKFTAQQDSSANTVAGFTSSMKVTSSSAYSVTTGDTFFLDQCIEGNNVADLRWGTANARAITISFWVRSSLTGQFGGALRNNAADRVYPFSYTIVAANTWEQKVITVAGDTSGTWLTTNGTGIEIVWNLGSVSSYLATAGAWTAANIIGSTGDTSVVGTSGATWYITGVQLEEGSQATPFEYRQYPTELAMCQRYFAKIGGTTSTETLAHGMSTDLNTAQYYCVYFPVNMRAAPTATISNIGASDLANGTVTANSIRGQLSGVNTCQLGLNTNSAAWLTTYRPMAILTTATSGNISLSAEL
jgi:hypothetical protein